MNFIRQIGFTVAAERASARLGGLRASALKQGSERLESQGKTISGKDFLESQGKSGETIFF